MLDQVMLLPGLSAPDCKCAADETWSQVGGPVPTALVTAQRLGVVTSFMSAWGTDTAGEFIAEDLAGEGVDLSLSVRDPELKTGVAQVWVSRATAERSIAYMREKGTISELREAEVAELDDVGLLHVDGWCGEAAAGLVKRVKRLKQSKMQELSVLLDAGSIKPGFEALIPHVDVVVASEGFIAGFGADRAVERLWDLGVSHVIRTQGAAGASWFRKGEKRIQQDAFSIQAVDTTGAGDVFCGALAVAILDGLPPRESLAFASAGAAIKCQGKGNRDPLPTREGIARLA